MPTIQRHLHGHGSKHTANHWLWLFSHYCFTSFHMFRKPSETIYSRLVLQSYTMCEFSHVFRRSESSEGRLPAQHRDRARSQAEWGRCERTHQGDPGGSNGGCWPKLGSPKMDGGYWGDSCQVETCEFTKINGTWMIWMIRMNSAFRQHLKITDSWNWLVKVNI